jgi:hypothetical protein
MRPVRWLACCALAASIGIGGPGAAAADAPPPFPAANEALKEKARDLFGEANELYAKGQFARAYSAALAAFSLQKHWQTAAILGLAEVKGRRFRDGAEHLAWALANGAAAAKPSEADTVRAALEEARSHVASVTVRAEPEGVEVRVDGAAAGVAPLSGTLFLEPGRHSFETLSGGKVLAKISVDARAGGAVEVALAGGKGGVTESPPGGGASVAPPSAAGGWAPAVVAGSVAVVGLGLGTGFLLMSSSKSSDRESALAALGGANPCGPGTPYAAQCAEIGDMRSSANRYRNVGIGSMVVGGIATGALVYFLWPREKQAGTARVAPAVGANGAGVWVSAVF